MAAAYDQSELMNALARGVAENRAEKCNGHGPLFAPITTINLNSCQSPFFRPSVTCLVMAR